jgi:putative FmdB family regulatory protein
VPTYQYACTDCGDRSEVVQKFTDDPLTVCGVCGGRLRKVFSPVGIVFKGSGFYRTDSRDSSGSKSLTGVNGSSSSNGESGAKDPGSSSENGSSAEKKSESSSGSSAPAASSGSSGGSSAPASSSSSSSGSSGSKVA